MRRRKHDRPRRSRSRAHAPVPVPSSTRSRTTQPFNPRKGFCVTPDDVRWWAENTGREPFVSTVSELNRFKKRKVEVIWHGNNTMEVVPV